MMRIHRAIEMLLPESKRLALVRSRVERGYGKDIAAARKAKEFDRVRELEEGMRFELDLQREEEDAHQTRVLLRKARRLYVPTPRVYEVGKASTQWYDGSQTGGRYLTVEGVRGLREDIRKELKARHEQRTRLVVWLSALTGIIGAVTGLVAVLRAHG